MKDDGAWDDLLAARALGVLPPAEAAQVDAIASSSPETRAELARLRAIANQWPDSLPVRPASPDGKRRLLAALDGPERFRPFFAVMSASFDLEEAGLLPLLAKLTDPTAWKTFLPDLSFFDFTPGPAAGLPEGGFIRLGPNAAFPRHRHLGREVAVILEGTLILEGRAHHPGDVVEMDEGSAHGFSAGPGRALVIMVAHGGLAFEF